MYSLQIKATMREHLGQGPGRLRKLLEGQSVGEKKGRLEAGGRPTQKGQDRNGRWVGTQLPERSGGGGAKPGVRNGQHHQTLAGRARSHRLLAGSRGWAGCGEVPAPASEGGPLPRGPRWEGGGG